MAATITTTPPLAFPGPIEVTFTPSTREYFLRLAVTSAPEGSQMDTLLKEGSTSNQFVVWEGYMDETPMLTFDLGGKYAFQMDVFQKGAAAYGGGYGGDPSSFLTETLDVAETGAFTIEIGQRVDSRLGAQGYGFATLRAWMWGDTLRATNKLEHGVATPEIINPTTPRAEVAVSDAAVLVAVAALIDQTAADLLGDLAALCDDYRQKISAHMASGVFHASGDDGHARTVQQLQISPSTIPALADWGMVLRSALLDHMKNLPESIAFYHGPATGMPPGIPDTNNVPVADAPGGQGDMVRVLIALADAYRAYEAHRTTTPSHLSADNVNVLTATLGTLLQLHDVFLAALSDTTGTGAATLNPGASRLIQVAGFIESTGNP